MVTRNHLRPSRQGPKLIGFARPKARPRTGEAEGVWREPNPRPPSPKSRRRPSLSGERGGRHGYAHPRPGRYPPCADDFDLPSGHPFGQFLVAARSSWRRTHGGSSSRRGLPRQRCDGLSGHYGQLPAWLGLHSSGHPRVAPMIALGAGFLPRSPIPFRNDCGWHRGGWRFGAPVLLPELPPGPLNLILGSERPVRKWRTCVVDVRRSMSNGLLAYESFCWMLR